MEKRLNRALFELSSCWAIQMWGPVQDSTKGEEALSENSWMNTAGTAVHSVCALLSPTPWNAKENKSSLQTSLLWKYRLPLVQALLQRKLLHNESSKEYDCIGILINNHFQFLLLEMTVDLPLQEKW